MVTSSLDLVLIILASLGGSLVFGGVAKGLGFDVPVALLMGGGIPLLVATYWHARVVAEEKAAYVRQTDAKTALLAQPPAPIVNVTPPPPPDPTDAETEAMRLAVEIFFRAGDGLGSFSENTLTGAGVCGSDTWPRLAGFYCSDAGHNVLRVVPGNVGTTWNHGHNLDSTLLGLASGRIPLPSGAVPTVTPPVLKPAAQRGAARKSATRVPVVDGEPSRPVA